MANIIVHKIEVTGCGWPDGYLQVLNPYSDQIHASGCGQAWNQNQGWEVFSRSGSCLMAYGPYNTIIPPGESFKVTWTLALGEFADSVCSFFFFFNNRSISC